MLTPESIWLFNNEAMKAAIATSSVYTSYSGVPPESKRYYEKMAELINAHFTVSSITQAVLLHPISTITEILFNMSRTDQALIYRFLYSLGHRIYK